MTPSGTFPLHNSKTESIFERNDCRFSARHCSALSASCRRCFIEQSSSSQISTDFSLPAAPRGLKSALTLLSLTNTSTALVDGIQWAALPSQLRRAVHHGKSLSTSSSHRGTGSSLPVGRIRTVTGLSSSTGLCTEGGSVTRLSGCAVADAPLAMKALCTLME